MKKINAKHTYSPPNIYTDDERKVFTSTQSIKYIKSSGVAGATATAAAAAAAVVVVVATTAIAALYRYFAIIQFCVPIYLCAHKMCCVSFVASIRSNNIGGSIRAFATQMHLSFHRFLQCKRNARQRERERNRKMHSSENARTIPNIINQYLYEFISVHYICACTQTDSSY